MHNWLNDLPSNQTLLSSLDESWDLNALQNKVEQLTKALLARKNPAAPVGVLADNSLEWIAIDLACHQLGIALIPLPGFFTPTQWIHTIQSTGMQAIFVAKEEHARNLGFIFKNEYSGTLQLFERVSILSSMSAQPNLSHVQKVTFTSGTTSEPKGVCLSSQHQREVAIALKDSLQSLYIKKHLNVLPLSVLLENVAGVYTALLMGPRIFAYLCTRWAFTDRVNLMPLNALKRLSRLKLKVSSCCLKCCKRLFLIARLRMRALKL